MTYFTTRHFICAALATVFATTALSNAAAAQSAAGYPCAGSDVTLEAFDSELGQVPVASGLGIGGNYFQVLSDPASGRWTIVMTMTNGLSCVMAVGEHWESYDPPPDLGAVDG